MTALEFPVVKVEGHPQFDWLPVAKIDQYPLEGEAYHPFAQGYLCISGEGVFVRLWAFEVTPQPDSCLRVALRLGEDGVLLAAEADADGTVRFTVDGQCQDSGVLSPHFISGEDLQGIYWGVNLLFPHSLVEELCPNAPLAGGTPLWGNLFKYGRGQKPHQGSFLPVDWSSPDPMGEDGLVRLCICDD